MQYRSSHRMCSVKKVFLEISQNSHENTCARVFSSKIAGLRPATLHVFFNKHVSQGSLNVSSNFFNLSLKCFLNVSYKFWFTPSLKNVYLQCTQLCLLFFFFQISSKLNLFSCRNGVYSLSIILSVCFDVKKDLIWLHLLFFSIR